MIKICHPQGCPEIENALQAPKTILKKELLKREQEDCLKVNLSISKVTTFKTIYLLCMQRTTKCHGDEAGTGGTEFPRVGISSELVSQVAPLLTSVSAPHPDFLT